MKRYLAILVLAGSLLSPYRSHAQLFDTIRASIHEKPRFHFVFNSRNSFITNSRARIFGFRLGVEFGRRFGIGGGLNSLTSNLYKDIVVTDTLLNKDSTIREQLSFTYLSYYVEYIFYRTKRWQFSIPLQMGIGDSHYEYTFYGTPYINNKKTIIVYEPDLSIRYKLTKWFGLSGNVGLRLMLKNNRAIKENFNSPTYSIGLLVFFPQIYKSIFPRSKLAQNISYY